jgi:hypothetical protein
MNVVANGSGATMAEARFVWMPASKAAAVAKIPRATRIRDGGPIARVGLDVESDRSAPVRATEMAARKEGRDGSEDEGQEDDNVLHNNTQWSDLLQRPRSFPPRMSSQ